MLSHFAAFSDRAVGQAAFGLAARALSAIGYARAARQPFAAALRRLSAAALLHITDAAASRCSAAAFDTLLAPLRLARLPLMFRYFAIAIDIDIDRH